jgi:hypothetical protein
MSKAVTLPDFNVSFEKVVQKIVAAAKVPFPKVDEVALMPIVDSVPGWANDVRMSSSASMPLDYPLGNSTLDMMAGIEPFAPLAQEIPVNLETFMPMEFPAQTPKDSTARRSVVALRHDKVPELPFLTEVPAEKEPCKKDLDAKDLENLLNVFKESGMDVKEVKLLPSGVTRITFDEFFGERKDRQPEFVRVGGRG